MEVDGLNGDAYPSQRTLAEWCGVWESKIRIVINQLRDKGFIGVIGEKGKKNHYPILWVPIYGLSLSELSEPLKGLSDSEPPTDGEVSPQDCGSEPLDEEKQAPQFQDSSNNSEDFKKESIREGFKEEKSITESSPSLTQEQGGTPPLNPPVGEPPNCKCGATKVWKKGSNGWWWACPNWPQCDGKPLRFANEEWFQDWRNQLPED
jgi:hypothetical protein